MRHNNRRNAPGACPTGAEHPPQPRLTSRSHERLSGSNPVRTEWFSDWNAIARTEPMRTWRQPGNTLAIGLMNKLAEFLQEDNGGFSSTRLAFLLWVVGSLIVWIFASFSSQPMSLAKIDPSVITVLGILMTGKVVQKFGEKPEPPAMPPADNSATATRTGIGK